MTRPKQVIVKPDRFDLVGSVEFGSVVSLVLFQVVKYYITITLTYLIVNEIRQCTTWLCAWILIAWGDRRT